MTAPVDADAVAGRDGLDLREHYVHVRGGTPPMHPACDQRPGYRGGGAATTSEADPHVPVLAGLERGVEGTGGRERIGAHDDVGRPRGNRVVGVEVGHDHSWGRRRPAGDHPQVVVHGHVAPIGPRRAGCLGRVELGHELVGGPQIVVVQERDPRRARLLDAGVARRADSRRAVVTRHPESRIGYEPVGYGGVGAVVNHDHLELDPALTERTPKRTREHVGAVARRRHHGEARGHILSSCTALLSRTAISATKARSSRGPGSHLGTWYGRVRPVTGPGTPVNAAAYPARATASETRWSVRPKGYANRRMGRPAALSISSRPSRR